ncbi:MAG TPA: hypothetical protein VGQ06_07975 [Gemmatimonadales bacterium]|jgi:hypothetical protein|nr:hypothetical protein [Gemmatimonadales bacterium]
MNERELREAVGRLPKSIEPPRDLWPDIAARLSTRRPRWYWLPLAAAAAVAAVVVTRNFSGAPSSGSWPVSVLAGRPLVGSARLAASGALRVGEWVETDDSSRALIAVGSIGRVEVKPGTRIRLLEARPDAHRLALARGAIDAKVDAPPRLFFVETPAGTAIDLGCAYTLETDSLGNGRLHVTAGYVEFTWRGRRSVVPLGAIADTRAGMGPGTPYVEDAPEPLRRALAKFDFESGGAGAAGAALASARAEDAVSLWHLLQRVDPSQRGAVYDRLAALVPPPPGVTRPGALALEPATLDAYWSSIRRILFRRVILRGVRDIDPRTGTTVK